MQRHTKTKENTIKDLQYYIDLPINCHHTWGDEWFQIYGDEFYKAIQWIGNELRKARIFVYDKEKWGTYNCSILGMYDGTIRWLLGGYSVRLENHWYDKVDRFFARIKRKIGWVDVVQMWQRHRFNTIFQKACKKWPHFTNEFIVDVDAYKWIKPCKKGIVDGDRIWSKYWTKAQHNEVE